MTIKTRNKLNISLFILSLCFLIINVFILVFSIYNKAFSLETYTNQTFSAAQLAKFTERTNFLTKYNPLVVIISLYYQLIYVCVTSLMLFHVFEKTQATDVSFFSVFLIALLANSVRIWLPLFNISSTFSNLLVFCGNLILFSKLLIPTSLLFSVVMSDADQRQDLEKNLFILILGNLFIAQIIPMNTPVICPNFEVDYSFRTVIRITSILIVLASLVALFFNNRQKYYTQLTTIGLACIGAGTYILLNSVNILRLCLSFAFMLAGNILYLKELHKQYLWND